MNKKWQWQANPRKEWFTILKDKNALRLNAVNNPTEDGNLWYAPNLLLQKSPAPQFTVTTQMRFYPGESGEIAGLTIMGPSYAYLVLTQNSNGVRLSYREGSNARGGGSAREIEGIPWQKHEIQLRVTVTDGAKCMFSYSSNDEHFISIGRSFEARAGGWIGAKVGIFHINPNLNPVNLGYSEFDWFVVE
jgi:beta-xylosidase